MCLECNKHALFSSNPWQGKEFPLGQPEAAVFQLKIDVSNSSLSNLFLLIDASRTMQINLLLFVRTYLCLHSSTTWFISVQLEYSRMIIEWKHVCIYWSVFHRGGKGVLLKGICLRQVQARTRQSCHVTRWYLNLMTVWYMSIMIVQECTFFWIIIGLYAFILGLLCWCPLSDLFSPNGMLNIPLMFRFLINMFRYWVNYNCVEEELLI